MAGFPAVGPNGTKSRDSVGPGRAVRRSKGWPLDSGSNALLSAFTNSPREGRAGLASLPVPRAARWWKRTIVLGSVLSLDQERRGKPIFCSNQMPVGLRIEWRSTTGIRRSCPPTDNSMTSLRTS